ncbi:hypothetical protein N7457_004819 [Penicillium paradoxum]|uniref:uncharacterized protein n=1 Tax=Penicillium paradoxum TaxID=176176 RepID=UPI002549A0C5|nr:uncharacterized protein N7457_004819 [Penicillium paradoxum]KAJ5783045.1 hypothetical protein N7457_004819 [Penicillium paradoxum]
MAHQAHNIPWSLLASNFHWSTTSRRTHRVTNLYPNMKPNQGKEITHFIEAFIRNIDDHSVCERKKYPATYEPADPTDIILGPEIVQKISPTVRRWRSYGCRGKCPSGICEVAKSTDVCRCTPIPDEEKKASAFLRPFGPRDCYKFFELNGEAFYNLEVVKTLLLYGEMDTILRVCALPGVNLEKWWCERECMCETPELGWDQVCIKALRAYICLNMVYCFPKTWDEASGKTPETDYRNSKFYQYTLRTCTGTGHASDVSTYPHRQFFGIADTQFGGEYCYASVKDTHWLRWIDDDSMRTIGYPPRSGHYGRVPIEEFLTLENETLPGHQPGVSDTALVRGILYEKGLPAELVLDIIELAGYEPVRRLNEPHDPFHPSNRKELAQYLTYCWRLLVHCDMIGKALGMKVPWQELLGKCIVSFWANDRHGLGTFFWNTLYLDEYDVPTPLKVFVKPESDSLSS